MLSIHKFSSSGAQRSGLYICGLECLVCVWALLLAATVGALYEADCMVGDRLAIFLFWDHAVRCIPALILETEGRRS